MMKMKYVMMVLALGALAFTGCSDDDETHPGNDLVQKAFMDKYPGATGMDWETRAGYHVVDFWKDNQEKEAWFDANAVWNMTETDLRFDELPQAVKMAFEAGEYKTWHIDDVDMLERPAMETLYIIEVEQGKDEMDLFYTADGTLVKAVPDTNEDYFEFLPPTISDAIMDFINERYPQARIIETEFENGLTEVDIMHDNRVKSVHFNTSGEWVYTDWEIRQNELPVAVTTAIQNSQYASYVIDDVDYVETPASAYYLVELEQGNQEVYLKITPEGEVLS